MGAVILLVFVAASLWLLIAEGLASAIVFFIFGLIITGALAFVFDLGGAAGGFVDRFIRRHR